MVFPAKLRDEAVESGKRKDWPRFSTAPRSWERRDGETQGAKAAGERAAGRGAWASEEPPPPRKLRVWVWHLPRQLHTHTPL